MSIKQRLAGTVGVWLAVVSWGAYDRCYQISIQMKHGDTNDFISKTNDVIHHAVKSTSCSRGWLRFTVQCIFCSVIVSSFCIIFYFSYRRSPTFLDNIGESSKCSVHNCKVICVQAPCLGLCEDHIVNAITKADRECDNLYLTLSRPEFVNSTLPIHWLKNWRWRSRLMELRIDGGNLKHISADAFMTTFFRNVETVLLEEITITTWHPKMLAGLFSLRQLNLRNCRIIEIHRHALREVDDNLEKLVIRHSGYFNPINITGSSYLGKLEDVNFSMNDFNSILNRNSFVELIGCKVLSLAASQITAIQEGAFDALEKIELIYLSNNWLTTLPSGIFDRVVAWGNHKLRIDLQDNMWICACQIERLREIHHEGVIITDPVCFGPEEFKGLPFSKIETFCNATSESVTISDKLYKKRHHIRRTLSIYMNKNCITNITTGNHTYLDTSITSYNCSNGRMKYHDWYRLQFITQTANRLSTELQPLYYAESANFSLVEISLVSTEDHGLIWYKSSCPNEIYCIERLPTNMRLYNVNVNEWYTICPIHHSGFIEQARCIAFNPSVDLAISPVPASTNIIYSYILAISGAGLIGGLCIYGLIRKNPVLLKGSKRILIVKHKFTDALVLPRGIPKIPPRCDKMVKERLVNMNNVLAVPGQLDGLSTPVFSRSSSIRSCVSGTPSYVSAIQPTESQLMEWRLQKHFRPSIGEGPSPLPKITSPDQISWIYHCDSLYYSMKSPNFENKHEHK